MRVYPEKLASALKKQLLPVYLVSGDEPLQVQECCDLIRQQARAEGCTDRELFDSSAAGFNWHDILHSASSMSLFSERKLLELRLPNGKPGAEGSKALCEYLEVRGEEDVLLIISGKIDKQSTNSKWFKALDKAGATLQIWPVDAQSLPGWLRQRLRGAGLDIEEDALQLLCEQVEGNLLAAVQEVEKLKLLATDGKITVRTVTASVADNARYNVFEVADNALRGDAAACLRMMHGLRAEGSEPLVVLWALGREIRTLNDLKGDVERGQSVQQALAARRVWNNRISMMQSALARHNRDSLAHLLELAARADAQAKGFAGGKPWDTLEDLVISFCGLTEPA